MVIVYAIIGGSVAIVGIAAGIALRYAPYAYGNAKVRAAKSRLITRKEFMEYAKQGYKDILYQLQRKGFKELLEHIDSNFAEENIQRTLRRTVVRELDNLRTYAPRQYKPFFAALQSQHEYDMIKAVIRSKINPHNTQHVVEPFFVQTPLFSQKDIDSLDEMTLDDFMFKLRGTRYHETVKHFSSQIRQGDLREFEKAFDTDYYAYLMSNARGERRLVDFVQLLIDIHNINMTMTFSDQSLIDGGKVTKDIYSKLTGAKSVDDVISALSGTRFGEYVRHCETPRDLFLALERFKRDYAERLMHQDPLSINPFLAFLLQRQIELKNIRLVLKLVHSRFTTQEIQEAII